VSGAVGGQVGVVGASQIGQSRCPLDAECGSRGSTQLRAGEHGSVIGEADQALVEGGIPEGGEEQAVVDIEALCVVAFGNYQVDVAWPI
jgi:hypothetical protein